MATLAEKLSGGIYGLLIGDALGVPYEFHAASTIPPQSEIDFNPPQGFARSHRQVPPGTWSDDGAQALILLDSLFTCGRLDLNHFAQGLVNWYDRGYFAVDGVVFDIGIQTAQAIKNLKQGIAPSQAGRRDERGNGNGSLMRVLPLALWHRGTDVELVQDAHQQSIITHGHLRSQICCALYCLWVRFTLQDYPQAWEKAVSILKAIYGENSAAYQEMMESICPDETIAGSGSGYVVDTLRSVKWAMTFSSYEQVVKSAISLGQDTDTTACVAGGIAGVREGIEAIPLRWRQQLRGQGLVEPLVQQLLKVSRG